MDRAKTVIAIAPKAPPCFESRDSWLEYLATTALVKDERHRHGPLIVSKVDGVKFNPGFDFCVDCTERHSIVMHRAGKCQPDYLQRHAAAAPDVNKATTELLA